MSSSFACASAFRKWLECARSALGIRPERSRKAPPRISTRGPGHRRAMWLPRMRPRRVATKTRTASSKVLQARARLRAIPRGGPAVRALFRGWCAARCPPNPTPRRSCHAGSRMPRFGHRTAAQARPGCAARSRRHLAGRRAFWSHSAPISVWPVRRRFAEGLAAGGAFWSSSAPSSTIGQAGADLIQEYLTPGGLAPLRCPPSRRPARGRARAGSRCCARKSFSASSQGKPNSFRTWWRIDGDAAAHPVTKSAHGVATSRGAPWIAGRERRQAAGSRRCRWHSWPLSSVLSSWIFAVVPRGWRAPRERLVARPPGKGERGSYRSRIQSPIRFRRHHPRGICECGERRQPPGPWPSNCAPTPRIPPMSLSPPPSETPENSDARKDVCTKNQSLPAQPPWA